MLAGLLINQTTFFILFTVIHFGCWMEYYKLMSLITPDYKNISLVHKYGFPVLGWCIMLYASDFVAYEICLDLILIFAIIIIVNELIHLKQISAKSIRYSLTGLLYISLSWSLMIFLRNTGWGIPVILIAAIWINDTMAYIVGSFIGKTPFSKISPKKTWEGTIGGAILCVSVIGFVLAPLLSKINSDSFLRESTAINWFVVAAIAAVTGTAGDLLESKIKRLAGVKDSGNIMPGHGGFLDRFDSLIIAVPFVFIYIKLISLI
jgi:phosphatidate cytidylyltransferase